MLRVRSLGIQFCLILTLLLGSFSVSYALLTSYELETSQELFSAGRYTEALSLLQPLAGEPVLSAGDAAGVLLVARIYQIQGNFPVSLSLLEEVPAELRTSRHELLRGELLLENDRALDAIHVLQPLIQQPLSAEDQLTLYQTLSSAAQNIRQPLLALYYLQQQLPISSNRATILQQAHRLLQDRMSDSDLDEAAFLWKNSEIGQDALLQLARRAFARQRYAEARNYARQIFATRTSFPYWYEATRLLDVEAPLFGVRRDTVGVMLPLSGRYAAYGDQLKKGLELAQTEFNRSHPLKVTLTFEDTAKGESPANIVSRLVNEKQVIGIIGPLLKANAVPAAERAQAEMIPMLSLAQAQGIPETGDYIFRDSLTPRHQVQALIAFALAHGKTRFSILYPQTTLGVTMTDLFIGEVLMTGGEIVDISSYPDDVTDFKQQIYDLIHMTPEMLEALETNDPEAEEYPEPPFDALFIPDYADKLELLAPQLVFYGLKDRTLLGINGWNSAELGKKAGRFLRDAVFVDAFFAGSSRPEVQRFEDLYRQVYRDDPSILAAQAFDSGMLMFEACSDPGLNSREDLRQRLAGSEEFQGVTGTTGFALGGESLKQLYLLQFYNGRVREYQEPEPEPQAIEGGGAMESAPLSPQNQ